MLALLSLLNRLTPPQSEIFIEVVCNFFLLDRSCWLVHPNRTLVEFIRLLSVVILITKLAPYGIRLGDAHEGLQLLIDRCLRQFDVDHSEFFRPVLPQMDENLIYISLLQKLPQLLYYRLIFLFDLCFDLLLLGAQFKALFFIAC